MNTPLAHYAWTSPTTNLRPQEALLISVHRGYGKSSISPQLIRYKAMKKDDEARLLLEHIACDLIWLKREMKIQRIMLESLGAKAAFTEEQHRYINEPYVHDDTQHIGPMAPGSACDNN